MTALIAEIEGYASIFHTADLNGDMIAPGAFAKSLRKNPAPAMLYSHAAEAPVGRWTSLREDARGLFVKGELILSSPRARELHALLLGGALDGLSIGYQTVRAIRAKTGRRIVEADLWEVSIVTFPMAPEARVTRIGPARPETEEPGLAELLTRSVRADSAKKRPVRINKRAPARLSPTPRAGARTAAEHVKAAARRLSQ